MAATHIDSYTNPLIDAFVAARSAVVKSPASFARQVIKAYVHTRWNLDIEPDDVRLNTFIYNVPPGSTSYPATLHTSLSLTDVMLIKWQQHLTVFSGLGHVEAYRPGGLPLRLVAELNHRYTPGVYEGLYRRSEPQTYDAQTHLNIEPAELKRFAWATDLRKQYLDYLRQFMSAHARHYPVLAKAAFIKAAFLQRDENSLREADKQLVLRSLGLPGTQRWQSLTPERLESAAAADSTIEVSPLKIHRYSATDVLIIKDTRTGRVVMYVPGNSSPLQGFESERKLAYWVAEQCRDPRKRQAFEGHFQEMDENDGPFLSGLRTALEGIAVYPHWLNGATGSWPPGHCVHSDKNIAGDPFVFVRDNVTHRLEADATYSIHSQGDARLEGFAQGLNRSLIFTGVVALIVPEAIPLIAGLSLALIGVGTAQAIKGRTLQDRQQGGQRILFGVLNALPLAVEKVIAVTSEALADAKIEDAVEAKPRPGGQSGVEVEATHVIRPRFDYAPPNLRALDARLRASLKAFEAPPDSVQGQPSIHGPNGMLDIYHRNGRYFLTLHDKAYEVRWEQSARQWRIISADGAGRSGPLLKQLENDQWDIDFGGLKGGMEADQVVPTGEAPTVTPSLHEQVKTLYPGFTPEQTAGFLAELRANGTAIEIQLARLSTEYRSLDRSLERWVKGPMTWRAVTDNHSIPITERTRRQAADIIRRCWQRQTPAQGIAARHIGGYVLDLQGLATGDLPHLPGDFRHVTAINLARTYISPQSASELIGKTPNLRWLNMESNFMGGLPTSIAQLGRLTRLTLANNRIVITPLAMRTLRPLRTLRLLNLERNPIGPLLNVRSMPQLINLFLRSTGLEYAPAGVFELPQLVALDLRSNRITTLPDEFFVTPRAANHTLLDGNPLSVGTRARIAQIGGPSVSTEQVDGVDVWLHSSPATARVARRELWDLYSVEEHADDFFEVLARLRNSADFHLNPDSVTRRVWQLMEAGTDDQALRGRLVAMAAHPQTCVDGATVMFSNMELEVLVTKARALAAGGREGPQLLKLVRSLFRLEEVDGIARRDVASRTAFTEDVEVMLAYRVGLRARLELPVSTQTMQFSGSADVSEAMLDNAEQWVKARETDDALVEFALKREFWAQYLERQYPIEFLSCQRPTVIRMEALEDLQSEGAMTDGDYKRAADDILHQRKEDEQALMKQLTQAELAGGSRANAV